MSLTHYCIVKSGLSKGITCAMLCHAAGDSSPGNLPPDTRVVALESKEIGDVAASLRARDIPHHRVEEEGELFAIGIEPAMDLDTIKRVTSSLPLIR